MLEQEFFWTWFVKHLCQSNRVILPNFGTFTLSNPQQQYEIRLKPTGKFKEAYQRWLFTQVPQECRVGERDPVRNVKLWGPIVEQSQSLENISLYRQLIWNYAQDNEIHLKIAAHIVQESLQTMASNLLQKQQIDLTTGWRIRTHQTNGPPVSINQCPYSEIDQAWLLDIMSTLNMD